MALIDIYNMAVGFVGGRQIVSLLDETVEVEQCTLFYDMARKATLSSRDWTFASTYDRRPEAVAGSLPDYPEYPYSYGLPSDNLVVREVSDNQDLLSPIKYQLTGNSISDMFIVANVAEVIYIRYTRDEDDVNLFTSLFETALAHKLAEYIAIPITGDKVMKRALMAESEELAETGGAIDGMQGTPKRTRASRLVGARYRGGGRSAIGMYV